MKDEPSPLGIADDCHIAEDSNGVRSIRRLPEMYGAFDAAGEFVERDKLTVVSIHGEKLVAIEGL